MGSYATILAGGLAMLYALCFLAGLLTVPMAFGAFCLYLSYQAAQDEIVMRRIY